MYPLTKKTTSLNFKQLSKNFSPTIPHLRSSKPTPPYPLNAPPSSPLSNLNMKTVISVEMHEFILQLNDGGSARRGFNLALLVLIPLVWARSYKVYLAGLERQKNGNWLM
jgi:hypothetical protein